MKGKEQVIEGKDVMRYIQTGMRATEIMQESAAQKREYDDRMTMIDASMRDPSVFFENAVQADEASAMKWVDELARIAIERMGMSPEQRELSQYKRAEQQRAEQARTQQAEQRRVELNTNWAETLKLSGLQDNPIGHAIAAEMREIQQGRAAKSEPLYSPEQMAGYAKKRHDEMAATFRASLTPQQRAEMVTADDVRARAQAQTGAGSNATIPSAPARATPPRGSDGKFQPGQSARVYDPFA